MNINKKIYFASDLHLGLPNFEKSLEREKLFVRWLDVIKTDAEEIYLLGDVFDFWYEYRTVVPRGFTRLLGKIAEITDSGIPVHFFTGNHDIWVFDYLPKETGVILHRHPIEKEYNGKKFFIGHGDGLGPGDFTFKMLKAFFTNPVSQFLWSRLHPNFALSFGYRWSRSRRTIVREEKFLGEDKEWLLLFAREKLKQEQFDYFIFGHRHLMLDLKLSETCRYINLGDWIRLFTFAEFDGNDLYLKKFI